MRNVRNHGRKGARPSFHKAVPFTRKTQPKGRKRDREREREREREKREDRRVYGAFLNLTAVGLPTLRPGSVAKRFKNLAYKTLYVLPPPRANLFTRVNDTAAATIPRTRRNGLVKTNTRISHGPRLSSCGSPCFSVNFLSSFIQYLSSFAAKETFNGEMTGAGRFDRSLCERSYSHEPSSLLKRETCPFNPPVVSSFSSSRVPRRQARCTHAGDSPPTLFEVDSGQLLSPLRGRVRRCERVCTSDDERSCMRGDETRGTLKQLRRTLGA